VGGDVFTRSLPTLNPLGTIVAIGFTDGLWQDPSVQWLVGRNASVFGFYLGRLMKLRPEFVHQRADELLELWSQGVIDPLVGATFPLGAAGDAHALIEQRRHVGKVVLEP
jgi:NADPH2:quinone reductase